MSFDFFSPVVFGGTFDVGSSLTVCCPKGRWMKKKKKEEKWVCICIEIEQKCGRAIHKFVECVFTFVRFFFSLSLLWHPLLLANVRSQTSHNKNKKQKTNVFFYRLLCVSVWLCLFFSFSFSFSSLHLFGVRSLVRMTDLSDVCFVEFYSFVFQCLHHQYVFSIYANFEAKNLHTQQFRTRNCGDLLRSSVTTTRRILSTKMKREKNNNNIIADLWT